MEHPCACGESDIRLLEFDHNDPAQKSTEVIRIVNAGYSWERVLVEIEKCTIRCVRCHRLKTVNISESYRVKFMQSRGLL